MEKFDVWISSAFAPPFFKAAITAATFVLFSFTASSTVGAMVCTETLKEKRSGVRATRPVPVTLTVSIGAGSRGGLDCAKAPAAMAAAKAKIRIRFMQDLLVKTSAARYNARLQICDARAARGVSRRQHING